MFIVIEWIDWSGKWTQVKLIKKQLQKLDKKVKIIDYPRYGKKWAIFVEKYLNWKYGKKIKPETASLFYALDRFDSSKNLKKDLKKYDYIISNRYTSSNMIHQAWKLLQDWKEKEINNFLNWLENLEFELLEIPVPDLVIFLDVNPEISQKLIEKKGKRKYIEWNENKDLHEKDKNHLLNAYNTAKTIAKQYNWQIVDCVENGEIMEKEKITNKILDKILN